MANKKKIFSCEKGHKILSSRKNEVKLLTGKVLCGSCGTKFQEYKTPSWSGEKHFMCLTGHIITIVPFGNGECNLSWGRSDDEYINLTHSPEEMSELLKNQEVCCPAGGSCNQPILPLDDCTLSVPKLMGIKTRVRVADVWEKYKCPEPKASSYDKDYNFHDTQFSKLNRERIQQIKQKRNTRPAGEIVTKATNRSNRGDKKPKSSDL